MKADYKGTTETLISLVIKHAKTHYFFAVSQLANQLYRTFHR